MPLTAHRMRLALLHVVDDPSGYLGSDSTQGPNTTISIPGIPGAKIVINEQTPVPGGLSVAGVHIVIPSILGVSADVVIAAATSDIHNCR